MAKLTGPIWTRPNWPMRPNRLGRPGLGWVQPNPDPLCPPQPLTSLPCLCRARGRSELSIPLCSIDVAGAVPADVGCTHHRHRPTRLCSLVLYSPLFDLISMASDARPRPTWLRRASAFPRPTPALPGAGDMGLCSASLPSTASSRWI
jgi:hypothetical protein